MCKCDVLFPLLHLSAVRHAAAPPQRLDGGPHSHPSRTQSDANHPNIELLLVLIVFSSLSSGSWKRDRGGGKLFTFLSNKSCSPPPPTRWHPLQPNGVAARLTQLQPGAPSLSCWISHGAKTLWKRRCEMQKKGPRRKIPHARILRCRREHRRIWATLRPDGLPSTRDPSLVVPCTKFFPRETEKHNFRIFFIF